MLSWFFHWRYKRLRKRLFKMVRRIAKVCLFSFYAISEEFPEASKKELYKMAIKTRPGYTDEKIETILETSLDSQTHQQLKFINYVHAVVMEEMDWDFDQIVKTPLKSPFTIEDGPEPKLWETYRTYHQIIASVIPPDL